MSRESCAGRAPLGAIGDLSHVSGPGKEKDEPKPDHVLGNGVNQPPRGRGASWHAAVEATQSGE